MKKYEQYVLYDNSIDILSQDSMDRNCHEDFFGGLDIPCITAATNLVDILVELELAPSKTWCRKNGWDRPISTGYNEFTFGMKKLKLCIHISSDLDALNAILNDPEVIAADGVDVIESLRKKWKL